MKKNYLMALDVGGGSGRCLLLEPTTGEVIVAKREWSHPTAPGTSGLGANLDATDLIKKLGEASIEALSKANAAPRDVIGIAAASMRNTTVILDRAHKVLFGTPNRDARALGEGVTLGLERGKEIHAISGHWPSPLFLGTRLVWVKNNMPDLLARAAVAFSLSDWVGMFLSGRVAAETSQAGETLLFDLKRREWASNLIESLGLPRAIFPEIVESGSPLGKLTKDAADVLGLVPGIPVAAGGADTQCGLLGAGAVRSGDCAVIAGTTMPIQMVTDRLILDETGRLWSGRHVVPGLCVLESNGMMTGDVIEWFSRIMYSDVSDPVRSVFADASRSVPGGSGVYSTFGAAVFDARTLGLPVGNLSISPMVTKDTSHGRASVARALIEGIAYSARANLEQITAVSGAHVETLHVSGGMSKDALWTRIVADVTGIPVLVPTTSEVTALGAAILAGVGAGVFTNPAGGSEKVTKIVREDRPGDSSQKYQGLYAGWREAHAKRAEADAHVSNLLTMSLFEATPSAARAADPSFRPKILVTASMDEAALEELARIGDITYADWRQSMKIYDGGESLAQAVSGCHVLITEMDIVDLEAIKSSPDLRMIITCRGNAVNVDLSSATAFGIPVVNTPGRNADAVADLAVAFMVMLARKMPSSADFLKTGSIKAGDMGKMGEAYLKYQGSELWRKTVGLVGLGSVGRCVARRLAPFGARVIFYDPAVSADDAALFSAEKVSFEELLSVSDFVSLHAPAIAATKGMMNRDSFGRMKQGAFFINTARASLVDDDALFEALDSGRLSGAALDVFSVEPPGSDDRIVSHPSVIVTPHLGGNTTQIAAHQGTIAASELRKLLSGSPPDYILNPGVLATFAFSGPRRLPDDRELERLSRNKRPTMTS